MRTILIVEDDLLLAAELERALARLGHRALGPVQDLTTLKLLLTTNTIDLVLVSINTKEGCTEAATYLHLRSQFSVPAIFLATYEASIVLRQMRVTQPSMFLAKPFTEACLQAAIDVAVATVPARVTTRPKPAEAASYQPAEVSPVGFDKFIFVRKGYSYVKLFIKNILYIEALQNYIRIYTATDNYIVDSTLRDFGQKLPKDFLKTHRSYIVNLNNIESYQESCVCLAGHQVPVSRSCQEELKIRINVLR